MSYEPDGFWYYEQVDLSLNKPGVYNYRMVYRKLFGWHAAYTCYANKLTPHGSQDVTDGLREWVATST